MNKIAAALKIKSSILYDDYLKFISSNPRSKIKQIRKNLNLTQKEFGDILDVHKKTIYRWEKGTMVPERKNFKKLPVFHMSSQYLNK